MREHGADLAREPTTAIWDTAKWFVSSEGHRIDQRIRECGGGIVEHLDRRRRVAAARSYGNQYGTRGWELVTGLDLPGNAARVGESSRARC